MHDLESQFLAGRGGKGGKMVLFHRFEYLKNQYALKYRLELQIVVKIEL